MTTAISDKAIIHKILEVPESARRIQVMHFQKWATKKCNDYMTEEDIEAKEQKLEQTFRQVMGLETIPYFIELYGDPRGIVVKILVDRLSIPNAREYMRTTGLAMDMGGDYSIVSESWLPQ